LVSEKALAILIVIGVVLFNLLCFGIYYCYTKKKNKTENNLVIN